MCSLGGDAVALYTSAWIEIAKKERAATPIKVALYTSAWIEISGAASKTHLEACRTLHECVD